MFFFSQDLLSAKKNSPLAIIWIAATLQSQKKLSKKQVNSVNVSSICRYLEEPDEEMALRLRANLMVGIVRVYRQQTDFLYSDINSVLINFKKALYDLHSGSTDLNMPREEANIEAITLPENEIDQLPGLNELAFSLNLAPPHGWGQSSQSTQHSLQFSSGMDYTPIVDDGLGPISSSPGIDQGVFGTKTGTSVSSKAKHAGSNISLPSFDQDLNFQALERQLSSHRDLLLLSNNEPGAMINLFGADYVQGQDMLQFDFNDDFGDRPEFPVGPFPDATQFESLSSWDHPQISEQVKSSPPADPNAQLPTPGKRKREVKKPKLVDSQTMLTDFEMKEAREMVNQELESNGLKMYRKSKRQPDVKAIIEKMVSGVPSEFQSFYRSCLGPAEKKKKLDNNLGLPLFKDDEYLNQPFNDDFGDAPIGLLQEQSPPPEIGRAESDIMPWHAPPSTAGTGTGSVRSKASKQSTPLKPFGLDFVRSDKSDGLESAKLMPSSSDLGIAPFELNSFGSIDELVGSMTQLEEKDQEIRSFQIYVMSLMEEGQVYLHDFISTFSRRTASSAFFNLLMCCHRGVLKAEQLNSNIRIFL